MTEAKEIDKIITTINSFISKKGMNTSRVPFKDLDRIYSEMQRSIDKLKAAAQRMPDLKSGDPFADTGSKVVELISAGTLDTMLELLRSTIDDGKGVIESLVEYSSLATKEGILLSSFWNTEAKENSLPLPENTTFLDMVTSGNFPYCLMPTIRKITNRLREKIIKIQTETATKKPSYMVKISAHLENQKFAPAHHKSRLWAERLRKKGYDLEGGAPGLNLTEAQSKALFALQKILHQTEYNGNMGTTDLTQDKSIFQGFQFEGRIPNIKFSPAQYLEAFGVTKRKTSRGFMEFSQNDRREAINALRSLGDIKFPICYERKVQKKEKGGKYKEVTQNICVIDTLFKIAFGFDDDLDIEKAEHKAIIGILPSPVFVDQIDRYFLQKPANLYDDIKKITKGKHSRFIPAFLEYLIVNGEMKRRQNASYIIKIGFKELAGKLRMDADIEKRRWSRIKKNLADCYRVAKELGYLISSQTIKGTTKEEIEELTLNTEKFLRAETVAEKSN